MEREKQALLADIDDWYATEKQKGLADIQSTMSTAEQQLATGGAMERYMKSAPGRIIQT